MILAVSRFPVALAVCGVLAVLLVLWVLLPSLREAMHRTHEEDRPW